MKHFYTNFEVNELLVMFGLNYELILDCKMHILTSVGLCFSMLLCRLTCVIVLGCPSISWLLSTP